MKFPYNTVHAITDDLHGFYRISHEAYHSGPGISSSKIKRALKSYAHYSQDETDDSPALAFGRAFHAALIEPELFAEKWVVQPQFQGHPNSNSYKDAKAAWLHINHGKFTLTGDEALTLSEMIRVVKMHPEYAQCRGTDAEIMGIATCPETGFKIKCKNDLIGGAIFDFKTTSGAVSESDVTYAVASFGYHISAAFYQDIVKIITGEKLPFIIIPVTKKAPFECEFYQLDDQLLEIGRSLYKAGLKRIEKWHKIPYEERPLADKKMRILAPSNRLVWDAAHILEFIK